jgi:hypothetical protein
MESSRAWVATRKGLFELRRRANAWAVERVSFLGEPVSMVLPPQPSGRMLSALNLGHFGVKLHASDDTGASWHELPAPVYPKQPEGEPAGGVAWKLVQIWALEAGPESRPGAADAALWAGTLPGGLFRSGDDGESWRLVEALSNRPGRAEWFGGGYDVPGIHSICPHPTRPGELLVGISCGGAWVSRDDGASWQLQADGMHAAYMPPDQAENPNTQDPHRIVRSPTCCGASITTASGARPTTPGRGTRSAARRRRASALRWRRTRSRPTPPGSCRAWPISSGCRSAVR